MQDGIYWTICQKVLEKVKQIESIKFTILFAVIIYCDVEHYSSNSSYIMYIFSDISFCICRLYVTPLDINVAYTQTQQAHTSC